MICTHNRGTICAWHYRGAHLDHTHTDTDTATVERPEDDARTAATVSDVIQKIVVVTQASIGSLKY